MHYLDLAKLGCDISLFLALAYLCHRFLRIPGAAVSSTRLIELEASLKTLVKEADGAGRELNDQLVKRRQELEKLLYEIETVEHRLAKSITSAEEKKVVLEAGITCALNAAKTIQQSVARQSHAAISPEQAIELPLERSPTGYAMEDSGPMGRSLEPPSFELTGEARPSRAYPAAKAAARRTLAKDVEREVLQDADIGRGRNGRLGQQTDLHKIVKAANSALSAGKQAEAAAFQRDEYSVQTQESSSAVTTTDPERSDPRLGVLAGFRRQVQVV